MNREEIEAAKTLSLRPNAYFTEPGIPYLYQKRMVLAMIITPRLVNGDDVGLGKTLEAVIAFTYMKAAQPHTRLLVQTEKIALVQWEDTFKWLTQGLKVAIITAETHPDPVQRVRALREGNYDVIITTYSLTYRYWPHLLYSMGERWVYIADEPNYFKNLESELHQRTFEMLYGDSPDRHGPICCRSYGLTATVVENRLEEAFAIFRICAPGTFQGSTQFERDYVVHRRTRKGRRVVKGYKNLDAFRRQIRPAFYGRLQDDPEVEQELPEVIPRDVPIILGEEQSRKLLEAVDRLVQMPSGEVKQVTLLPSLILAQQLANDPRVLGFDLGGEKTPAILEMLDNSLKGEKIVIYSKLRRCIDQIQKDLEERGYSTCRITGKEDDAGKQASKEAFMKDTQVLLMTRAGQKALDGLQKVCNSLFFYDMPWSYGWYRQAVGRLKRTGSNYKRVGVYRMLAVLHPKVARLLSSDKTIDHHSLTTVLRKHELFKAVTGDVLSIETSESDLVDIFEEVKNSYRQAA